MKTALMILANVHAMVPFAVTSSKMCAQECINKGQVFCPDTTYPEKLGQCGSASSLKINEQCSIANRNEGAKYLRCPREKFCGKSTFVGRPNGQQRIVVYGKSAFTSGSLCMYHFRFPENAKRTDKLKVVVYDTYRVQLYYAAGLSKLKAAGKKIEKSKKLRFQVTYPQELFLTFESHAD